MANYSLLISKKLVYNKSIGKNKSFYEECFSDVFFICLSDVFCKLIKSIGLIQLPNVLRTEDYLILSAFYTLRKEIEKQYNRITDRFRIERFFVHHKYNLLSSCCAAPRRSH